MGRRGIAEDIGRQLCAYIRLCLVATHGTDLESHVRAFLDVERNASREGAREGAGPLQRSKEGGQYRIVSLGPAGQPGGWVAPGGRGERWGVTLGADGEETTPAHRQGQDVVSLSVGKTRGFNGFEVQSLSFEVYGNQIYIQEQTFFQTSQHFEPTAICMIVNAT